MNRRQTLVALAALCAAARSTASLAQQQGRIWRVGFLALSGAAQGSPNAVAFLNGLRELGYVDGRNLVVEWRHADGKPEALHALAAELVQLNVDVIVAAPSSAIAAARKATVAIPIVMATAGDPIGAGLVRSLARPGGNITGLSTMGGDTGAKQVDLLRAVVPKLSRLAVLDNTSTTYRTTSKSAQAGAQKAGVKTLVVAASTPQELEQAFATVAREKADAIVVGTSTFSSQQQRQIAELALKYRLPSVFGNREYVEAGGLMSFGTKFSELYRRSATFVDKILKGAKPADLPVEQPVTLELVVNLRTAKALGLTIPQSLVLRADDVIS
jgi:putative tryptophan/tyrosine transport system substrate-binding protein